jgi:hypothetical protein
MSLLKNNILSLSLIIATSIGVLAHDTQVDKATVVAFAAPAALAAFALADIASKSNEHVHVDKVSSSSNLGYSRYVPKIPPREDTRRYILEKKIAIMDGNAAGLWPST